MESERIVLRNQPQFELILNENNFEVIDEDDKNNSGIYSYKLVNSVELKTKKVNWIITFLSFVVGFFVTSDSFGDVYREENKLTFNYDDEEKIILLTNCDMAESEKAIEILNKKINKTYTQHRL